MKPGEHQCPVIAAVRGDKWSRHLSILPLTDWDPRLQPRRGFKVGVSEFGAE